MPAREGTNDIGVRAWGDIAWRESDLRWQQQEFLHEVPQVWLIFFPGLLISLGHVNRDQIPGLLRVGLVAFLTTTLAELLEVAAVDVEMEIGQRKITEAFLGDILHGLQAAD